MYSFVCFINSYSFIAAISGNLELLQKLLSCDHISNKGLADFTQNEIFNLLFLESKYGPKWKMFLREFKDYFNNKTPQIFHHKFLELKKSENYKDLRREIQHLIKDETELLK